MKTWEKIYPGGEGYAFPRQVLFCALEVLGVKGEFWPMLWLWLSYDGYLRQQDAEALCFDDFYDDGTYISIILSPRARGERAKTGSDQGFQIDCPILTHVVRCVLRTMG